MTLTWPYLGPRASKKYFPTEWSSLLPKIKVSQKYVVPGDGRVRDGCPQQQNRQTEAVCSINRYIICLCDEDLDMTSHICYLSVIYAKTRSHMSVVSVLAILWSFQIVQKIAHKNDCHNLVYNLQRTQTAAQMTSEGETEEMSRSIKLPQTIDVALRNIRDAKVRFTNKYFLCTFNVNCNSRYLPWTLEAAWPK